MYICWFFLRNIEIGKFQNILKYKFHLWQYLIINCFCLTFLLLNGNIYARESISANTIVESISFSEFSMNKTDKEQSGLPNSISVNIRPGVKNIYFPSIDNHSVSSESAEALEGILGPWILPKSTEKKIYKLTNQAGEVILTASEKRLDNQLEEYPQFALLSEEDTKKITWELDNLDIGSCVRLCVYLPNLSKISNGNLIDIDYDYVPQIHVKQENGEQITLKLNNILNEHDVHPYKIHVIEDYIHVKSNRIKIVASVGNNIINRNRPKQYLIPPIRYQKIEKIAETIPLIVNDRGENSILHTYQKWQNGAFVPTVTAYSKKNREEVVSPSLNTLWTQPLLNSSLKENKNLPDSVLQPCLINIKQEGTVLKRMSVCLSSGELYLVDISGSGVTGFIDDLGPISKKISPISIQNSIYLADQNESSILHLSVDSDTRKDSVNRKWQISLEEKIIEKLVIIEKPAYDHMLDEYKLVAASGNTIYIISPENGEYIQKEIGIQNSGKVLMLSADSSKGLYWMNNHGMALEISWKDLIDQEKKVFYPDWNCLKKEGLELYDSDLNENYKKLLSSIKDPIISNLDWIKHPNIGEENPLMILQIELKDLMIPGENSEQIRHSFNAEQMYMLLDWKKKKVTSLLNVQPGNEGARIYSDPSIVKNHMSIFNHGGLRLWCTDFEGCILNLPLVDGRIENPDEQSKWVLWNNLQILPYPYSKVVGMVSGGRVDDGLVCVVGSVGDLQLIHFSPGISEAETKGYQKISENYHPRYFNNVLPDIPYPDVIQLSPENALEVLTTGNRNLEKVKKDAIYFGEMICYYLPGDPLNRWSLQIYNQPLNRMKTKQHDGSIFYFIPTANSKIYLDSSKEESINNLQLAFGRGLFYRKVIQQVKIYHPMQVKPTPKKDHAQEEEVKVDDSFSDDDNIIISGKPGDTILLDSSRVLCRVMSGLSSGFLRKKAPWKINEDSFTLFGYQISKHLVYQTENISEISQGDVFKRISQSFIPSAKIQVHTKMRIKDQDVINPSKSLKYQDYILSRYMNTDIFSKYIKQKNYQKSLTDILPPLYRDEQNEYFEFMNTEVSVQIPEDALVGDYKGELKYFFYLDKNSISIEKKIPLEFSVDLVEQINPVSKISKSCLPEIWKYKNNSVSNLIDNDSSIEITFTSKDHPEFFKTYTSKNIIEGESSDILKLDWDIDIDDRSFKPYFDDQKYSFFLPRGTYQIEWKLMRDDNVLYSNSSELEWDGEYQNVYGSSDVDWDMQIDDKNANRDVKSQFIKKLLDRKLFSSIQDLSYSYSSDTNTVRLFALGMSFQEFVNEIYCIDIDYKDIVISNSVEKIEHDILQQFDKATLSIIKKITSNKEFKSLIPMSSGMKNNMNYLLYQWVPTYPRPFVDSGAKSFLRYLFIPVNIRDRVFDHVICNVHSANAVIYAKTILLKKRTGLDSVIEHQMLIVKVGSDTDCKERWYCLM